jgi:hypothetical protein
MASAESHLCTAQPAVADGLLDRGKRRHKRNLQEQRIFVGYGHVGFCEPDTGVENT